jgi:hypothetical protein
MIFLSRNTWAEKCLPGLTGQYFLQKGPSVGTGLDLSRGSVQTCITARLKNLPPIFQISPTKLPCAANQRFFLYLNCVQRYLLS